MTEEEKDSLKVINFRLNHIDTNVASLVESNKDLWKLMAEQRAQKEHTKNLQATIENIDRTLATIWRKHDQVADVVLPKHETWTEAASNQKKLLLAVAGMMLAGIGTVLGLK